MLGSLWRPRQAGTSGQQNDVEWCPQPCRRHPSRRHRVSRQCGSVRWSGRSCASMLWRKPRQVNESRGVGGISKGCNRDVSPTICQPPLDIIGSCIQASDLCPLSSVWCNLGASKMSSDLVKFVFQNTVLAILIVTSLLAFSFFREYLRFRIRTQQIAMGTRVAEDEAEEADTETDNKVPGPSDQKLDDP